MKNFIDLNLGITAVYLLLCRGGYLLIDTGYETDYEKFRKELARVGISIDRIKYLLLTHYHSDHAGFANRLKYEFDIPLIVQKTSVPLLAQGNNQTEDKDYLITFRMQCLLFIFQWFQKSTLYPPVLINDSDILVDGDDQQVLRSLGVDADILFTPGHTPDSMSVLCDDGTAFVGDAASNFLKFAGTSYRPICYNDLNQMYASMQRLIAAGAKTIVPAHGKPFSVTKLQETLNHFYADNR